MLVNCSNISRSCCVATLDRMQLGYMYKQGALATWEHDPEYSNFVSWGIQYVTECSKVSVFHREYVTECRKVSVCHGEYVTTWVYTNRGSIGQHGEYATECSIVVSWGIHYTVCHRM